VQDRDERSHAQFAQKAIALQFVNLVRQGYLSRNFIFCDRQRRVGDGVGNGVEGLDLRTQGGPV
jgi:hypothetical protein